MTTVLLQAPTQAACGQIAYEAITRQRISRDVLQHLTDEEAIDEVCHDHSTAGRNAANGTGGWPNTHPAVREETIWLGELARNILAGWPERAYVLARVTEHHQEEHS